jgi:DNA (cytosine-5)-methyltransferase 1
MVIQYDLFSAQRAGTPKYHLPSFDLGKLLAEIQRMVDDAPGGIVQLVGDLFCGAGGTSEGIEQARYMDRKNSCIIFGINHDEKAIYSQSVNHPLAYYTSEDIRFANLEPIIHLVQILRARFPQCPFIIWASLECTNHSNAKGGQSRDEDSRTLAWDLNRYIEALDPDGLWIENVREFEIWGPLIEKVEWVKRKKKVKPSYPPLNEQAAMEYWWNKIDNGEIGSCPLAYKYAGKGKKKHVIDYGPTWVTDWRFAGIYYKAWTDEVCSMGYHFQQRILNAADFGAPTNRYRFFVLFMRKGWPIAWPEPSHSKEGGTGLFAKKKHVPVRTCLDFSVQGRSVFEPGHVDSEKTWERIYEGLVKFVAGGKDAFRQKQNAYFITKYMGNNQKTGVNKGKSIDEPCLTVTTQNRLGLIEACRDVTWLAKYYSSHNNTRQNAGQSIDEPSHTITTRDSLALVDAKFIDVIYGRGYPSSIDEPAATVRTKDGQSLVDPKFIMNYQGQSRANDLEQPAPTLMQNEKLALIGVKYFLSRAYRSGQKNTDIDRPSGTIMPVPKADLVQVEGWVNDDAYLHKGTSLDEPVGTITAGRHYHYLYNPAWFGHVSAVDEPCMCIVARQDKAPISAVTAEQSSEPILAIPVFDSDSPMIIKVKEFMVMYDIYDIKKRMLMIPELLKIQSFPEDYYLAGTQTDQKKFIGNAVPPKVAKAIAEAMYLKLSDFISQKIAA